jgi:hypothetical protein
MECSRKHMGNQGKLRTPKETQGKPHPENPWKKQGLHVPKGEGLIYI